MIPTQTSEEANDDDHETSDQVTTKPRRSTRVRSAPEWYGNPVLKVMLLVKEICPRGNNKVVIYISLYHDKCLLFMLELY